MSAPPDGRTGDGSGRVHPPILPALPLAGQVAVVTGGSSGLGLAFAQVLGAAGAEVVLGALPGSGVPAAVAALEAAGIRADGVELDVADLAAVEGLRDRALARGGLDIWVNNAGASGVYGATQQIPSDVFERVLDANVRGVFHGTRTALSTMVPQGHGHLVNVWGRGATGPVPWQNAYASSKAWNRAFTRAARAETRGTGVRVHGYDPGLVLTAMLSRVTVAPGMERRVTALPWVAGLWGQRPEQAAAPLLPLLLGRRDDFQALRPTTLLTRGLRSVAAGRLRRDRRIELQLTTLS